MTSIQRAATIKATIVAALLVGACLQSLQLSETLRVDNLGLTLTLLPFLPLPYGLLALRYGPQSAIAAALGLFGGVTAIAMSAGQPTDTAIVIGLTTGLSVGGLAAVLWGIGLGRPFQRHALAAMSVAFLVTLLIPFTAWVATVGHDNANAATAAALERRLDRGQKNLSCEQPDKDLSMDEVSAFNPCESLHFYEQQLPTIERWAMTIIAVLFGTSLLPIAATTNIAARIIGVRANLPIQRVSRAASFRAHWSVAYLVAGSLMLLIVGLDRAADNWWTVIGVAGLGIGLTTLLTSGFGVLLAVMRARKSANLPTTGMWVATVLMLVLALPVALAAFVSIGIFDLMVDLRARLRGTIDADQ